MSETGMGRWVYLWVGDVNLPAGERTLDTRLSDGWEPFAVTDSGDGIAVHLRRWEPLSIVALGQHDSASTTPPGGQTMGALDRFWVGYSKDRKRPEPPEGVVVKDRQVVIYLNQEGAEWLASCLPTSDGFTRDVLAAVDALAAQSARGTDHG